MEFVVECQYRFEKEAARSVSLSFRTEGGKLTALGVSADLPTVGIHAFRPERDIYYRTPESLTPGELKEEVAIHVPQSLHASLKEHVLPSTLGTLILMQYFEPTYPAISPLAALRQVLLANGSVNSAMLQADNSGLLFVRKAGDKLEAHASGHSLKAFLELPESERDVVFPDFVASEIVMSGYDLDHFESLDLGPLKVARRISIADLTTLCQFSDAALEYVKLEPHLYTLCIGAAAVVAQIVSEAA